MELADIGVPFPMGAFAKGDHKSPPRILAPRGARAGEQSGWRPLNHRKEGWGRNTRTRPPLAWAITTHTPYHVQSTSTRGSQHRSSLFFSRMRGPAGQLPPMDSRIVPRCFSTATSGNAAFATRGIRAARSHACGTSRIAAHPRMHASRKSHMQGAFPCICDFRDLPLSLWERGRGEGRENPRWRVGMSIPHLPPPSPHAVSFRAGWNAGRAIPQPPDRRRLHDRTRRFLQGHPG